jgi:hypothetical protein
MKPIKLNEGAKGWTILYNYKGRKVVGTKHFYERIGERNQIDEKAVNTIFERAMDSLVKKKRGKEKTGEYLVYSKEFKQGIVIDFRDHSLDGFEDGNNNIVAVTFLPRTKSKPADNKTTRLVVESSDVDYFSHDLASYIYDTFDVGSEAVMESVDPDKVSIIRKKFNDIEYVAVFSEGKLWNIDIGIVEVD